jgi:Flp pilus assembly protein TadB
VILVPLLLGAAAGLGAVLVLAALSGRQVLPAGRAGAGSRRLLPSGGRLVRVALVLVAVIAAWAVTGWVAGAILAGAAAWVVPAVVRGQRRYQAEVDKVEAVAAWAEILRDTMAGASGLEQAISTSATVAPEPIAPAVTALAVRLDHLRLAPALRAFADDVDHPACDFVVAGLLTAAEHQARELGPLLTQLARCARDEAEMRLRVWAGRARARTSVKVISASVGLFATGLVVFDRSYLEPYDAPAGQATLLVIGAIFAGAVLAMGRMGRIDVPERFVGRRAEGHA